MRRIIVFLFLCLVVVFLKKVLDAQNTSPPCFRYAAKIINEDDHIKQMELNIIKYIQWQKLKKEYKGMISF